MNYIFYPKKDATIYERTSSMNTGLDQILEVGNSLGYNNRALIQFDVNGILEYITDNSITDYNVKLNLYATEAKNVPLEHTLEIYPLSSSWDGGIGKWQHTPITRNDVSWINRKTGLNWQSGSYPSGVTGSYNNIVGGGNWYYDYKVTQSFDYKTTDIGVDINSIFNLWVTGSIENNGLIIKFSDDIEKDVNSYSGINFFSNETNTIFVPRLSIQYDDSVYVTGSSQLIPDINNMIIAPKLKREYFYGGVNEIDLTVRKKLAVKTFSTQSSYIGTYRLPSSSYYSIVDVMSNNVIIDFSEYTKISYANNKNFFNLSVDSLFPKRTYKIKFKVVDTSSSNVVYYTYPYSFKVLK